MACMLKEDMPIDWLYIIALIVSKLIAIVLYPS